MRNQSTTRTECTITVLNTDIYILFGQEHAKKRINSGQRYVFTGLGSTRTKIGSSSWAIFQAFPSV